MSECLPSVFSLALGKEIVCRVSDKIHSAKNMTLGKAFDSGSAQDGGKVIIMNMVVGHDEKSDTKHLGTQVMFDLFIMMVNGVERDERE